jgi:hypothetical protein
VSARKGQPQSVAIHFSNTVSSRVSTVRLNIADSELRPHTVTTVRFETSFATTLREWVQAQAGATLGWALPWDDHPGAAASP